MKIYPNFKAIDRNLTAEPSTFIQCCKCGKYIEIPISESRIKSWTGETLIQNEFPELTPAQREMILTKICDDCWNKIFPEEDDY